MNISAFRVVVLSMTVLVGSVSLICATIGLLASRFLTSITNLHLLNDGIPWGTLIAFTAGALLGITGSALVTRVLIVNSIRRLSRHMRTLAASTNLSLRLREDQNGIASELAQSVNAILDTTEYTYLDMLQAQYDAEHANKGKSLFIAKVSHELRTPIHSITGMLRILLKQEQSVGKRQYIQMARDSAQALLSTINEVLDYSKMQGGTLSLENKPFDLVTTLRSSVEQLIPRFEEKPAISFTWDVAPGIPKHVLGDAARIQNIVVNLLGNAFKFTDQGKVHLQISPYNHSSYRTVGVRIEVADTGIGIPANKLSHIFDPFTTADDVTARLYPGTGLGLAIVKQIVETMDGTVSVVSTPKQGSRFTLDLPFELDPSSDFELYEPKQRSVAMLTSPSTDNVKLATSLRNYGCNVTEFDLDDSSAVNTALESSEAFDVVYIEKCENVLIDEIEPLVRRTSRLGSHSILSVKSSEIAAKELPVTSEHFTSALLPTSALDLLLIADGDLAPCTSLDSRDEITVPSTQKLRILVADDAQTNRIILKNLLEDAGHHVELVENGRDLLERIMANPTEKASNMSFDLVLTDIQMPIMDGITATQNFRKLEREVSPAKKLPIVAVTSYAFPEECSKMLASGIDHIITKPISPKRLSNLLSQITCEVEYTETEQSRQQSDSEIIEELCKVASAVADRVSSFSADIEELCPMAFSQNLNLGDVYERSGNSIKRTGLILEGFNDSYRPLLELIESAVETPIPTDSLSRSVHAIKGLLLDVGADSAAALGEQIERRLLQDKQIADSTELRTFVDAIRNTALIVREVLSALPSLEIYSALPSTDLEAALH